MSDLCYHSDFSAVLLKVVYGICAADEDDPYIALIDDAQKAVSQGLVPGKYLVELLPILAHVPSWFPGAGWQKLFARWRAAQRSVKDAPLEHVKKTVSRDKCALIKHVLIWLGTPQLDASHSVVGDRLALLERSGITGSELEEEEEVIKSIGAVAFEGEYTRLCLYDSCVDRLNLFPAGADTVSNRPRLNDTMPTIESFLTDHSHPPSCVTCYVTLS